MDHRAPPRAPSEFDKRYTSFDSFHTAVKDFGKGNTGPRADCSMGNPFWVNPEAGLRFTPFDWVPAVTKSVFTEKYERFCDRLVSARNWAGLTQIQLAERLGRPQSFVSKYERGERRLDVVEFLEVARAIGVDPSRLLKELDG